MLKGREAREEDWTQSVRWLCHGRLTHTIESQCNTKSFLESQFIDERFRHPKSLMPALSFTQVMLFPMAVYFLCRFLEGKTEKVGIMQVHEYYELILAMLI